MIRFFFERYLSFVLRFPYIALAITAALTLFLAVGLPNFKLDASAESLTLENDRDLDFYRDMSERFDSGEFLVVTYRPEADLFSDEALDTLKKLQAELEEVPGVTGVDSILNVPLLYSPKRSLSETIENVRTLQTEGVDRQQAKQEFLTSPLYKNLILSDDGQTTALQLNLELDRRYLELVRKRDQLRAERGSEDFTEEDAERLEKVSEAFRQYRTKSAMQDRRRVNQVRSIVDKYDDNAEIFVGGVSMIAADMIRFIQSDLMVFGVAVLLFMIGTLAIIFRAVRFVIIPMAVCLTAVIMMLGYISWLDWRLTVISSNFVALLLIISLAITVHLVVRYREYAIEFPGWTQRQLVEAAVRYMARPCLYTALTTIVAFTSLVVSGIRPVIDFGWMMTIGLVVALVLAFVILPAALMILGKNGDSIPGADAGKGKPLTAYLSDVVDNHPGKILWGALLLAGISAWGISRLTVENKFIDYFHDSTEIYQGLSVIDNKLGGTTTLSIVITADPEDVAIANGGMPSGFTDEDDPFAEADPFDETDPFEAPEPLAEQDPFAEADPFSEHGDRGTSYWMTRSGLKKINELHSYLEEQPEIGIVRSLATLFRVGKDINGGLNDFELALMEKSLPPDVRNVLLSPYLAAEANQTRISMRVKDLYPGLQRQELENRLRDHIEQSDNFEVENVRFSGLLVLYNNMLQSLFSSQIQTLGAVFFAIMLMFVALFRSLLVAVIAIIPTGLAAASVLGLMGLAGLPLDMMTITIASITVGIGVDHTIHYIHRFKTEIASDWDYIAAMHRAHGSIGRAMFYTSVIIIFGFSIMVLSKFVPTVYFGLLTGLAMFAALAGSLLLLPRLILLTRPFGRGERE